MSPLVLMPIVSLYSGTHSALAGLITSRPESRPASDVAAVMDKGSKTDIVYQIDNWSKYDTFAGRQIAYTTGKSEPRSSLTCRLPQRTRRSDFLDRHDSFFATFSHISIALNLQV